MNRIYLFLVSILIINACNKAPKNNAPVIKKEKTKTKKTKQKNNKKTTTTTHTNTQITKMNSKSLQNARFELPDHQNRGP